jgi:hypothetical protein
MIMGINYERCKNARPMPAKVAEKVLAAHKELKKEVQREWEDIPVHDVVNNTAMIKDLLTLLLVMDVS